MPKIQGIRIALVSQYDAKRIPEYHLADHKPSETSNAVDAIIPIYSCSQFWIRYSCRPPPKESNIRFFYFKLYVAGKFQVAWGCGAQDEWRGVTVFIPVEVRTGETLEEGRVPSRQKLGLFFAREGDVSECGPSFEIRVFRAKARKREHRQYTVEDLDEAGAGGIQMDAIGVVKKQDPRRFYTYALIDPTDEPYATFRYHCRDFGTDDTRKRGIVESKLSTQENLVSEEPLQQQSPNPCRCSLSESLRSLKRRFSISSRASSSDDKTNSRTSQSEYDQGTHAKKHQDAVAGGQDGLAQPLALTDATFESWKTTMWKANVL